MSQPKVCTAVLFLLFLSFIPIAYAEEEPISIFLDCYEPCKGTVMNYSNGILFELKIRNNLDNWVGFSGSPDLDISVTNDNLPYNGKESKTYNNLLGQSLIKPKDEIKIYIPFDIYNKIDADKRLGDWKVYPKLTSKNVIILKNPLESYGTPYYRGYYGETVTIIGNVLEFKTVKPETSAKVQKETGSNATSQDLWENPVNKNITFPTISQIIAGLILGLIAIVVKYSNRRKRKR